MVCRGAFSFVGLIDAKVVMFSAYFFFFFVYLDEFYNQFSLRIISKFFWRGTMSCLISIYRLKCLFDAGDFPLSRKIFSEWVYFENV